ncbi:phosphatase PAP2 family protein [Saccharothrix carnea]|nr:phosphatase PAP2 family protein [Saccharothrix carnea]
MMRNAAPLTVPVERFVLRAAAALVLTSTAAAGYALVVAAVRFRWSALYEVDRAVAETSARLISGNEVPVDVLQGVTTLGGTPTLVWLTGVGVAWLLVRQQLWLALYVAVTAGGAMILGVVIEELVAGLRPVAQLPVPLAAGSDFAGGHALGSAVTYGVVVLVFLPVVRRSAQWVLVGVAALLVVVIGATRIALGVHGLTDVLGGWMLGGLWLALTGAVFRRWRTEAGARDVPLSQGMGPEAAADIRPAPAQDVVLPRPWRGAVELLAGWGLLAGVLHGAGRLVVGEDRRAAAWESAVLQWWVDRRSPEWDAVVLPLGKLGDVGVVLACAAVVAPLALAWWRSWSPVVFLALTAVGAIGLALVTAEVNPRAAAGVPGFTSAHVAATSALWGATAVVAWSGRTRWWRWPVLVAGLLIPTLVAVQGLYAGAHYPTDVAAGMLSAAAWTALVWWVVRPDRTTGGKARPQT